MGAVHLPVFKRRFVALTVKMAALAEMRARNDPPHRSANAFSFQTNPFESAGFCIEWGHNHFLSVRIRVEKSPLSESAMAFVAVMTSDPPISTTLLAPALRAASLPPADFAKAGPNTVIQYIRRAFSQSMV